MTVQLSPLQSVENRLLPDNAAPTAPGGNFQRYLDEEQRRVTLLFNPFGQFDFSSWFSYPAGSPVEDNGRAPVSLFADLQPADPSTHQSGDPATRSSNPGQAAASYEQLAGYSLNQSPRATLQQFLQQTGWLTPNLAALPQFNLAQLQGKLLSKLDLGALVDEILTKVEMVKQKGSVELNVALKPGELGEILLSLTSRSGMISIQIQAPEETRKLLQDQLAELAQALKKAKVNLVDLKVSELKEATNDA